VQPDVRVALTTLLATHLLWIAIGFAICLTLPNLESFSFFFAAVGVYAFIWNASTALQFRAQCRERFARLSTFSVAYPAYSLSWQDFWWPNGPPRLFISPSRTA